MSCQKDGPTSGKSSIRLQAGDGDASAGEWKIVSKTLAF